MHVMCFALQSSHTNRSIFFCPIVRLVLLVLLFFFSSFLFFIHTPFGFVTFAAPLHIKKRVILLCSWFVVCFAVQLNYVSIVFAVVSSQFKLLSTSTTLRSPPCGTISGTNCNFCCWLLWSAQNVPIPIDSHDVRNGEISFRVFFLARNVPGKRFLHSVIILGMGGTAVSHIIMRLCFLRATWCTIQMPMFFSLLTQPSARTTLCNRSIIFLLNEKEELHCYVLVSIRTMHEFRMSIICRLNLHEINSEKLRTIAPRSSVYGCAQQLQSSNKWTWSLLKPFPMVNFVSVK